MSLPTIILVGYPSSQIIVPVSKYLTEKYLPFHTIYLNNDRGPERWSEYVADFLEFLTDDKIILALDDYLISGEIDMAAFNTALKELQGDVVAAKLCYGTPEEHEEYPVTTQYTIWDRKFLIELLRHPIGIYTPWDFEISGSILFKGSNRLHKRTIHRPCIPYFTNSSMSSRWIGIRLDGLSQSDINYIKSFYGKKFVQ